MNADASVAELLGDQAVDLNNCDREPIHRIGAVQRIGVLIGHDGATITHLADADGVTGLAVGDPVDRLPPAVLAVRLDARVDAFGRPWHVATHEVARTSVIELEPVGELGQLDSLAAQVASMSKAIESAADLHSARQLTAELVRTLTGFDRVMVYEFHPDEHGEVVAESKVDELEPFLGLHYPATDIPRQARALLVVNPIRQFIDVASPPVPISRAELAPELDLSASQLRAHSPIHTEYLVNMGVGATLTLSITVNNRLAALIACHHRTERHIPLPVRRTAELLARLLSEQFARRSADEQAQIEQVRLATQFLFLRELIATPEAVTLSERLLTPMPGLIDCDGFLARRGDELHIAGDVDRRDELDERIVHLLASDPEVGARSTDHLDGIGGGVVVARLADGYLAWYRQPAVRHLRWAGASDTTTSAEKELTPRASFAVFVEELGDRSAPWTERDLVIAGLARRAIEASTRPRSGESAFEELVLALAAHAQNLELANIELGQTSRDLEEFAYVVAHDLRAPLRSVRSFLQLFREDATEQLADAPPIAIESLDLAMDAASSMQGLLEAMLEYALVGRGEINTEVVHLGPLVERVIETTAAAHDELTIEVGELPAIEADPRLLATLITNLLVNAAKYRHHERAPRVRINALERAGTVELRVEDNGSGIDPSVVGQVFEMFRRGTPQGDGVGAGLAIVKRIVASHGGQIRVESEVDVGTTFVIDLPVKARPRLQPSQ
ncbi:MAG: ATP-binding protein [Actinomycetota bacterium]